MPSTTDIIQNDDVRGMAEMVRNKKYQFRRAFRRHDATNLNSNSFTFPQMDIDLTAEEVAEIPEGSTYPRADFDYETAKAVYSKYGVEITISDEAVEDSYLDVEMDGNRQLTEAEEERMDKIAFEVLNNNLNSNGPIDASGDSAGTLEYADFVDARTTLFDAGANLSDLFAVVNADGMGDLLKMSEFTQASELGDNVITSGLLPNGNIGEGLVGTVGDIPVYATNVGGTLSAGQAIVGDASQYGWESERDPFDVDNYREDDKDQTIYKLNGRYDWLSTNSEVAVKIDS